MANVAYISSLLLTALLAGCSSAPTDGTAAPEAPAPHVPASADPWAVSDSVVVAQYDTLGGYAVGLPAGCDGSIQPIMRTAPVPAEAQNLLVEIRYGPQTTGIEVSYSIDGAPPASLGAYNHVDSSSEQLSSGNPPFPEQRHLVEIPVQGQDESDGPRWEFLVQHHITEEGCYDGGSFGDASVFVYAVRDGHGHDCVCATLKSQVPAGGA